MDTKMGRLSDELKENLAAIRSAVGKLSGSRRSWDAKRAVDLVAQGDRMVRCYEDWLLDDEQKQVLNLQSLDMFILQASSYLCDIGLADDKGLPLPKKGIKDVRTRTFFNPPPAIRSFQLIRDRWRNLGIPDRKFAGIIAQVCRQAGAADSNIFETAESQAAVIDGAAVNLPLLVACLQLGKAFDLTSHDTILQINSHMPRVNRISPDKLEAYFKVADAGAHPHLNGTIHLKIQCSHPEVHKALKHHERFVQQLLEKLNQQVRPRFLYSAVIYEIEPDGYTPIDLKFTVDSSAGLQLFMGNRLYTDKRVFLRELIQNAVDACNYRKLVDNHYAPAIVIEFNEDVSTIKVRDNGIGMTRQWIEKYFLAIGISFYQSSEIQNVGRNPRIDFGSFG